MDKPIAQVGSKKINLSKNQKIVFFAVLQVKTDMSTFDCPNQCDTLCKLNTKETLLFNHVYYPTLTTAERALIAKVPKESYRVFKQKNIAETRANLYFPKGLSNDESDAFRHFVWAGLLTKELGSDLAKKFLDAHENTPLQPLESKSMDLANNRAGVLESIQLKKQNNLSLKSIEKSALEHLREDKLIILNKRLKIPGKVKK